MKNIFITFLLITLIACKEETKLQTTDNDFNHLERSTSEDSSCLNIIKKIVKSSDLNTANYKNYLTRIDRIENDSITIQVYIENNLSDNNTKKQIVESNIAWLLFLPNEKKLFNVSSDPNNPIELKFDENILISNDIFISCQIIKKENKSKIQSDLKYCILPFDFDKYYSTCIYPSDDTKCLKEYPKYTYTETDYIAKIIKNNYYLTEYLLLPKLNDYQPIVLCDTDGDIESYNLIIVNNKEIVSSLEIGKMDGESIIQFNISKDYIITLYKRNNTEEEKKKWKNYKINELGKIIEIK